MNNDFGISLQKKRKDYGVSQNKLAVDTKITRQYLSSIESGKAIPSQSLMDNLNEKLERYNPNNPLEMILDYVRIRFPTNDVKSIIKEILKLKIEYMLYEDYAFYSYAEQYVFGDIVIMVSPEIEKGCLLELKGKGCRQFENFLLAQKRNWFDFFKTALNAKSIFKRIDLAINDKNGLFDITNLSKKCEQEECISVFRSFKSYKSGELVKKDEKIGMGNTLYIGSQKSEIYFCIYEKDYEQYIKNGIDIEDSEIKNRFEIRLKNDRAYHAIIDLMQSEDIGYTIFSIINRYIRFVDKEQNKRRTNWKTNESWEHFIGKECRKLKLTTKPEPYTFQKTLNWLSKQVAPTLKLAITLDGINDTCIIGEMIDKAKLSKRHQTLLQQQTLQIKDVIIE